MLHFVGHRNSENLTKLNVGILSDGRNGGAAAGGRNRTAVFCDAQADPCSQGPTKPAHSPPDSHTDKKKKKKNSFPEIHLLQKLCSLFVQKSKM